MRWTPLILDTFTFDEAHLETPEALGDLGGSQAIEQHDFPGGTRTQKAYGYFPSPLKWRARFHGTSGMGANLGGVRFLGNEGLALVDPSERVRAVGRIVAAGKEVKLQYGDHSWFGRVARFSPTAHHSWLYEYELEFWPRIDFGSPGPTLPPVTDLGTVLALHVLSLQSLIKYGLDPDLIGQVAAAEIGGPIGFFISQTLDVVAGFGGNFNNINDDTQDRLHQLSQSTLATLAPYQASPNPVLSSPASDAAARVKAIQIIMSADQPTKAVVRTVNPNLVVLASQHYNDSTKWRIIAEANGLSDPQPIGSFNLVIPQAPR